jgi:hypothetical protein
MLELRLLIHGPNVAEKPILIALHQALADGSAPEERISLSA